MIRKGVGAAAVAAAAAILVTSPAIAAGAVVTNASGPDYVYGVDNPLANARVEIHGTQTGDGRTIVTLEISGVDRAFAGQTFGAHVHVHACGPNGADALGHYKNDTTVSTPVEGNEVWLDFTVTDGGTGHARAERDWTFTSSAQSVVIHAPGSSTRLACTNASFHV